MIPSPPGGFEPTLLTLPAAMHPLGTLTFAQAPQQLPFVPQRVYWVTRVPVGSRRGEHAHRRNHELLIVLHGRCRVELLTSDGSAREFVLDDPRTGLLMPPPWWRRLDYLDPDTICLVLASEPYDEAEYIRNAADFFEPHALPSR